MIQSAAPSISSTLALAVGTQAASGDDAANSADFAALLGSTLTTGQDGVTLPPLALDPAKALQMRQAAGTIAGKTLPLDQLLADAALAAAAAAGEETGDTPATGEAALMPAPVTSEIILPGLALTIAAQLPQAARPAAPPAETSTTDTLSMAAAAQQAARLAPAAAGEALPVVKPGKSAMQTPRQLAGAKLQEAPLPEQVVTPLPAAGATPGTAAAPVLPDARVAAPAPAIRANGVFQPMSVAASAQSAMAMANGSPRSKPAAETAAAAPAQPTATAPAALPVTTTPRPAVSPEVGEDAAPAQHALATARPAAEAATLPSLTTPLPQTAKPAAATLRGAAPARAVETDPAVHNPAAAVPIIATVAPAKSATAVAAASPRGVSASATKAGAGESASATIATPAAATKPDADMPVPVQAHVAAQAASSAPARHIAQPQPAMPEGDAVATAAVAPVAVAPVAVAPVAVAPVTVGTSTASSQPAIAAPAMPRESEAQAAPASAAPKLAEIPAAPAAVATAAASPTMVPVDTQSFSQSVAPVTTAPAAASTVQTGHDFAALVDRLVEARQAAVPEAVTAAISHSEFGKVSLRFDQDAKGLSVAMSSADPDFAKAVQASAASTGSHTASDNGSTAPKQDNQGQQQQTAGSASGQSQSQSQGQSQASGRGERDSQPNSRSGRAAGQSQDDDAGDKPGDIYA